MALRGRPMLSRMLITFDDLSRGSSGMMCARQFCASPLCIACLHLLGSLVLPAMSAQQGTKLASFVVYTACSRPCVSQPMSALQGIPRHCGCGLEISHRAYGCADGVGSAAQPRSRNTRLLSCAFSPNVAHYPSQQRCLFFDSAPIL